MDNNTNSSILQDKCFDILNQRLVDGIELSVHDLYIDNADHKVKLDPTLFTPGMKNSPHLDSYKWIDCHFGLVLQGESLNGRLVKTNDLQTIIIDFINADHNGQLELAMEGPGDTSLQCFDKGDGTYMIKYQPVKPGPYELTIKFKEQHIHGMK